MTDHVYKLLLVDDDPLVLEGLCLTFEDDYPLVTASNGDDAVNLVREDKGVAVAVLDIKMPGKDGIEVGREINKIAPDVPIIFHTAYAGEYSEEEIEKSESPYSYVEKGASLSQLKREVRHAMEAYVARTNTVSFSRNAERSYGIVGRTDIMREVFDKIRKVAPQDSKVMILGETGTGKELVARAIHRFSQRADKPLVIFNCNHKSPDLVESELFGHGKGAFTGAISDAVGLFEYAHKGTIFLDEIGDLDITTQAKILRVLEEGEFYTVGKYTELKHTDVRVICATNHDLEAKVAAGEFREDLYYRLRGVVITVPPLRERRQDIPLLIKHFMDSFTVECNRMPKHLTPEAVEMLIGHNWRGNVRDLKYVIEALVVLTESHLITPDDVLQHVEPKDSHIPETSNGKTLADRIHEFRRNAIIKTLDESGGNIRAAARSLSIDPGNLRRWIKEYNLTLE